jgi:prepilin-type N-terminal cleavage/methylation domain-containing protein
MARGADAREPGNHMQMLRTQPRDGFTLIDMMVAISLMAILAAAAVPQLVNVADSMKLGQAQRDVDVELSQARLLAVSANRPIRIRFNCPVVGQYRITELIGSPSVPDANDTANDRCSDAKWPYPANDSDPATRPNHDGPVRYLPNGVTFGSAPTLEFWANGTVHKQAAGENPWAQVDVAGTAVTVVRGTTVKTVTVNGLGKIQLVQ